MPNTTKRTVIVINNAHRVHYTNPQSVARTLCNIVMRREWELRSLEQDEITGRICPVCAKAAAERERLTAWQSLGQKAA